VDRLRRLPSEELPSGIRLREANTFCARLLGLALLDHVDADEALLIPRCRSIHTFAMRFALDVVFVDARSAPLRVVRDLRPRRLASCRGAAAAIEVRAGEADRLLAGLSLRRARAGRS
jgi:uncharacterized membrane protein (UPF0127 family)